MEEDQKDASATTETPETPAPPEPLKSQGPKVLNVNPKKKSRFPGVLIVVVVLIIGGLVFYFVRGRSTEEAEPSPTPFVRGLTSPTTLPEETSEPEAEVDKEDVSISILNGSGIAGAAAFLQDKLEDLGYTQIDTGNASNQDNEATSVTFSSDLDESIIDEITEELEDIYEDVNTDTSSSQEVSVEIITGLRQGQTPKPEATETAEPTDEASPTASPTADPSDTP